MCSETANYSSMKMPTHINNNLTFYIPHINSNIATKEYIKNIFHNLNIGKVERVCFIGDKNFIDKVAFVYMEQWYNTIVVEHLQEKIIDDNQEAIIVYDDPNSWTLLPTHKLDNNNIIEYFNTQDELLNIYAEQVNYLNNQNLELKTELNKIKSWVGLPNMENLSNTFTNNSCCGAVSPAWNPNGESSNVSL